MMIRNGWLLPAAAIILGATGMACAQPEKTPGSPQPAPAASPSNPAEAKAVLERSRSAYRALKTYQDTARLKFELRARDAAGQDIGENDSAELTFVFAGPRKFALRHADFGVYSDGQTQTAHLKFEGKYVQGPAGEELMEEAKSGAMGVLNAVHTPANLLISLGKAQEGFPLLAEVTGVKAEEREGKPGNRVWGKGELPGMVSEERIPMTIWFAGDTGLIGEVTVDLTPSYVEILGPQAKVERATGTISFVDIKVDAEVPAERYTFTPSAGDKKVKSFDPQQELVGEPAPAFAGIDLDGNALSLADLKGKTVLLFCWATTCGPSMQWIGKIGELGTAYADKGVVVIGLNENEEDEREQIKKQVMMKKLTFRQLMDPMGEIATKFRIEDTPCVVLIDGVGMVRWIRTGAFPSMTRDIAEKLDKVVKGENPAPPVQTPK